MFLFGIGCIHTGLILAKELTMDAKIAQELER